MTAAFLKTMEVADRLGISQSTFYHRRPSLEAEGFPKPDPVMRAYLGEDVEAWLKSRRKVSDPDTVTMGGEVQINFDAL